MLFTYYLFDLLSNLSLFGESLFLFDNITNCWAHTLNKFKSLFCF